MLWLFVVFALVWPRPVYAYVAHSGGDLRGKGLCSLALPARSGVSGAFSSQIARFDWRDGLICDRPVVQRAGLRMHTLGKPQDPGKEARRWVLARHLTSTKASSRSRA